MSLSIGAVFEPLNTFFLERFGTPAGSPVVFRFEQFGSSVSEDDFRTDPSDPTSPLSATVARERVSDLVNRVPQDLGDGTHVVLTADPIDSVYADLMLKPAQPYLPAGTTPGDRSALVGTFNTLKADALKLWEKAELTSVLGSPIAVHATDTQPVRWWDAADPGWKKHALTVREAPRTEPSIPVLWRTLPTETKLVRALDTVQPLQPVDLVPIGLVADRGVRVQTLSRRRDDGSVDLPTRQAREPREVDLDLRQRLRLREVRLDLRERLRLKQLVDEAAPKDPVTTDSVDISFEFSLVTLTRDWWHTLVTSPTWRIPGREAGSLNAPGVPGGLRQLPIGFIAVRNLHIRASWSDADRAVLGQAMAWGPFDVSASVGTSDVAQPGLQIVGWLLQEVPAAPPNPPVDGVAAAADPAGDPSPRTYRVRSGDTLRRIAQTFYGDPAKYRRIQKANQIKDAARIEVGQVLVIP